MKKITLIALLQYLTWVGLVTIPNTPKTVYETDLLPFDSLSHYTIEMDLF